MRDKIDSQILNILQKGLPIVSTPFKDIAAEINITEDELFTRINAMKADGTIRRISGFFNSCNLGYTSLLCAAAVPEDRIDEVASIINEYPGITHNYLRNHDLNMWFTLIAKSNDEVDFILDEIQSMGKLDRIVRLPAIEMYKVKVNLSVGDDNV